MHNIAEYTESLSCNPVRYEKLEAEVTAGAERFDEIMRKWLAAKNKAIPQELQELLQQQRAACDAMIEEKDKLTAEFQQELKAKDDQYVKYLKKQAEDVDLILERMEEQARTLLKAYREELGEIEGSFDAERRETVEKHRSEWEGAMESRQSKERGYLAERERRLEENEAQLQHLRVRNAEEFNRIKIKLETDIQVLQQQIQQMKATFQLNAEKLEYNFQVLKKRDEENTVTISQQKRKLTRLQDTLNSYRTRVSKQERTHQDELDSLMDEYRKNTEMYRELQKKVKHFQSADAKRFYDIWAMNEETVRGLASEVLHADEVVHRQQLGLDWEQPPAVESPMTHFLHQTRANTQLSQATLYASQVLSDAGSDGVGSESEHGPSASSPPTDAVYPSPVIRTVLELLCQESDFLIESKLVRLLAPLEKDEQMLMKLDSIFKALGVDTEEDVHTLVRFFVQEPPAEDAESAPKDEEAPPTDTEPKAEGSGPARPTLIHPNEVPQALRSFVEHLHPSSGKSLSSKARSRTHAAYDEVLDGKFWGEMAQVLPESHERVWSALLEGLEGYHSTLKARAQLIEDTDALQLQNSELRMLLHQYMQARINRELQIPPTLMLPVPTYSPSTV